MWVRYRGSVMEKRRWETNMFKALELAASMEARRRREIEKCIVGRCLVYI